MTTAASDPAVRRYLDELRRATQHLPHHRRDELIEEIEAHIREALATHAREADVREVLERLGDPHAIADEESRRLGIDRPRAGAHEWAAVVLLLVGGLLPILPVVGWFVGFVLLWASRVWSTRDKLIGTFVLPGGLVPAVSLLLFPPPIPVAQTCRSVTRMREDGPTIVLTLCEQSPMAGILATAALIVLVLLPVLTAAYLVRRALAASR